MPNKWQQIQAVTAELLRMEAAGEVRRVGKNADGVDVWEQTELGREVALKQMGEDFGVWAPLVRLLDRVRAWWHRGLSVD